MTQIGAQNDAQVDARIDVDRWVKDYGALVFSVCAKVLRNPEAALDASQHVWEIVVRHSGSFLGKSEPSTWIYAIAYREALRASKREKRIRYRELLRTYHDANWQPKPAETDDASMHGWLSGKCDSCLTGVIRTLPFKARVIFTFRYVLDLSFGEIARIVDMKEDAVRQAAGRARKTLAEFLESECGLFRMASHCKCGLEKYLDQTSFRSDILALRTITRIAGKLHEAGSPVPPLEYWEKISALCHKREATTL